MAANDIKIFLKMKNKGWLSIVKNKGQFIFFIFKTSFLGEYKSPLQISILGAYKKRLLSELQSCS